MSELGKVWVVGANSFTGRYLVPTLRKANYSVNESTVDITNAQQVKQQMLHIQPDYVINLAAISFVPDGGSAEIYAVNTFGPQHILDASLELLQPPKKIILASSANIYGSQDIEQIDESCQPNPVNHYGCSKLAMEQIAKTYSDRLDIITTRPFNYTGMGQETKFLIPKIVEHFKQKADTIKLGNIEIWRDFSDVRWISQIYSKLLSTPNQGFNIVNLCSNKLTNIRTIIDSLQQITGHTLHVETDYDLVRQVDIKRQCGDNQHLFKTFSGLAKPIDIKETLKWMVLSEGQTHSLN